jgi:hypothetical protein
MRETFYRSYTGVSQTRGRMRLGLAGSLGAGNRLGGVHLLRSLRIPEFYYPE